MMLQGSLGQQSVTQKSQLQKQPLYSLNFREEVSDNSERRNFEVEFDGENGLVKASRGKNDTASLPYLLPYQDPLGLLYQVRQLGAQDERVRVPMLGKEVLIERLGKTKLETPLGERSVQAYSLLPGDSRVYVDSREPHHIVKLTQRAGGQLLDALLVKISTEAAMPEDEEPRGKRNRKRKRRRRGGRRNKGNN